MNKDMTLLKEENHQLHLMIERLEKEKILRNMEGTKGVARPSIDHDSCVVWGGASVSGNTWAKDRDTNSAALSNRAYVPVSQQRLGKVGDSLEVPFRTSDSDYHLRPKRLSSSAGSFNELSTDGDAASLNNSAHSIALSTDDEQQKNEKPSSFDEGPEEAVPTGRMNNMVANMIG